MAHLSVGQVGPNLLAPVLLRPVKLLEREREYLDGGNVEVHEDVAKRGAVGRLRGPALVEEEVEPRRASRRDREGQARLADAVEHGRLGHVLVRNLARQQLPEHDAVRPDVHLLRATLRPHHLRRLEITQKTHVNPVPLFREKTFDNFTVA